MRNLKVIFILFLSNFIYGQSSETGISEEIDKNVSTVNGLTKINLLNIDFNGQKIPLNLSYSHTGVKVNEGQNSVGITWNIENLGYINRIVNDYSDNIAAGWFNTPNPDFTSFQYSGSCSSDCPTGLGVHSGNDLSPDFFSLTTSNGNYFDFFYKKNISGLPIPVFLSNPNGYKVNTNFENFIAGCSYNSNVVFNVLDNEGNNYDFINGPVLQDVNRSSSSLCRNNFYLKSIKSPNNNDAINIEYRTTTVQKQKYYRTGFTGGISDPDYTNGIVRNVSQDYYFVDESRFDLSKITSTNVIIDFIYNTMDDSLDEVNVTDINGNYLYGYKFEYNMGQISSGNMLWRVLKYDKNKVETISLYVFEYFDGQDFTNNEGNVEDYFGYYNAIDKTTFFPLPVRNSSGYLLPPDNYQPNLEQAKQHSLKKIINKQSGIIEFDYQLKKETHEYFGNAYGGGLIIASKKVIPQEGRTLYTSYTYEGLYGYIILTDNPGHHYKSSSPGRNYFKNIPNLDFIYNSLGGETTLNSIHGMGSFFQKIHETTYNYNDMSYKSKIIRDYIPNYEGIYLRPIIKKETYYDSNYNIVKRNEYNYNYETIESITRALFNTEVRSVSGTTYWTNWKNSSGIPVNRVNIINKKELLFDEDYNSIEKNVSYTYANNSKIVKSALTTSSIGESMENKYFYATDTEMSTEPQISNLLLKNMVGIPLDVQSFRAGEKLFEDKTIFSNDVSTSNLLLPKFIYKKKGADLVSALEKKKTFDKFDDKGNVLQETLENGIAVSYIWGYNKTQIIAKIENIFYSSIPASTINNLQSLSNTGSENDLITALNSLRSSLSTYLMTTYTYKNMIGISTITDYKGDVFNYEYDDFNELKAIRDKNNNIITEYDYNYKP